MTEQHQHEKLALLKHFLMRIETVLPDRPKELVADSTAQDSVGLNFCHAVQQCAEVGGYVVAKAEGTCPPGAADVFETLRSFGMVSDDTANAMKEAVEVREQAMRQDSSIDWNEFHAACTRALRDFRAFGAGIEKWLPSAEHNKWRLDHIEKRLGNIRDWTGGDKGTFMEEPNKFAVLRSLYEITDCTRWLSAPLKHSEPGMPWGDFAEIREVLAGTGSGIDDDAIWRMIEHDLPLLDEALGRMKARTEAELEAAAQSKGSLDPFGTTRSGDGCGGPVDSAAQRRQEP